MAIYLQRQAKLVVASDADYELLHASRDQSITDSTLEGAVVVDRELAGGALEQIQIGALTAVRVVRVEVIGARANLRIGAADADPIPILPISVGQIAVLHMETTLTAAWIENPGADAIRVRIVLVGTE